MLGHWHGGERLTADFVRAFVKGEAVLGHFTRLRLRFRDELQTIRLVGRPCAAKKYRKMRFLHEKCINICVTLWHK